MNRGLLLTLTEPPAAMEEEFNAWYDDEHLAERLAIPGFLTAKRWVADVAPGEGRYLGTYELDSPAVLQSEKYLQRFRNQTPWSKRCLSKAVVFRRWACEQVFPGTAAHDPSANALLLALGNERMTIEKPAGVLSARLFHDPNGKPPYAAIFELADAQPAQVPGLPAGWSVRLFRAYTGAGGTKS